MSATKAQNVIATARAIVRLIGHAQTSDAATTTAGQGQLNLDVSLASELVDELLSAACDEVIRAESAPEEARQ